MHVGDDIDQIENGKMPMKLYWFLFFSTCILIANNQMYIFDTNV